MGALKVHYREAECFNWTRLFSQSQLAQKTTCICS
jgi:hypothetical protein